MRKTMMLFLVVFVYPFMAHAGVLSSLTGFLEGKAIEVVIAAITAIAGIIWAGGKVWTKFFKEAVDVPLAYKKAKDPKSPGGSDVVESEKNNIITQIEEATKAGVDAFSTLKKKNGK